jgi:photosystem II stability/assembly factor-like uncharacterized protein
MADSWTRIGTSLADRYISTVAIDPKNTQATYVGGRVGIQKSSDGGQSWQTLNTGLESLNIRTIAINPLN